MTLTAVLLAGGESKRMEKDKATIVFYGQPLWRRQVDLLRRLGPEKILISAREEPPWLPIGTELLLDEPPSRGPLSGLTKTLEEMRTSHLVALAVDMPFMTSDQMQALWSVATIGCGVLPMIAARAEPLAAIYPREVAADFAAALSGSDYSLQTLTKNLVRAGKVQTWDVPDEARDFFRSVNEPGDLALEA